VKLKYYRQSLVIIQTPSTRCLSWYYYAMFYSFFYKTRQCKYWSKTRLEVFLFQFVKYPYRKRKLGANFSIDMIGKPSLGASLSRHDERPYTRRERRRRRLIQAGCRVCVWKGDPVSHLAIKYICILFSRRFVWKLVIWFVCTSMFNHWCLTSAGALLQTKASHLDCIPWHITAHTVWSDFHIWNLRLF